MLPARAGSEQAGVGPALEALALGIGEYGGYPDQARATCLALAAVIDHEERGGRAPRPASRS
jgi:hypothetical protein